MIWGKVTLCGVLELQLHLRVCPTSRQVSWVFIPSIHHWPQASSGGVDGKGSDTCRSLHMGEGAAVAQRQASEQGHRCQPSEAGEDRAMEMERGSQGPWQSTFKVRWRQGLVLLLRFRRVSVTQLWPQRGRARTLLSRVGHSMSFPMSLVTGVKLVVPVSSFP